MNNTPHQKFCFYHLSTRGWAGITLGDAWYVSNVSIFFDCSMLYYLLFWTLLGFIIHFYIIFGTNLLTGGPAEIDVFLPISVFRRKGISNRVQTEWNLWESYFWNGSNPGDLEYTSGKQQGRHEAGRRALPPGRAPHPRGPFVAPLADFFRLYMSIYPKNIEDHNRSGVPPPQASVATKNLSGACSGTLLEGESITGGHLHHPGAIHDEEGVVHPRGWGYVPVAMCLISLSLSLSLVFLIWHDLDVPRALVL